MKYLITGGCGFLGSNLASEVIRRGDELILFDNLSRLGSRDNLAWLEEKAAGKFKFRPGDMRVPSDIELVIQETRPDSIFHLAGQVAMTTSIANPALDFATNAAGTHALLEAVRKFSPGSVVIYSSTNKVYGEFDSIRIAEEATRYVAPDYPFGFDETLSLSFCSPYGCSKGAADQFMLDYAGVFGLKTVVFRHSSIFGGRQFSTEDQGWIGWFVAKALEASAGNAEPFTISGDGKQVRDVLFADDLIQCYFSAASAIDQSKGQAFNIGGGMENSLSLLELFDYLEQRLSVRLKYIKKPWRQSDQKVFVADTRKATRYFGWKPKISKSEGLDRMIEWVKRNE